MYVLEESVSHLLARNSENTALVNFRLKKKLLQDSHVSCLRLWKKEKRSRVDQRTRIIQQSYFGFPPSCLQVVLGISCNGGYFASNIIVLSLQGMVGNCQTLQPAELHSQAGMTFAKSILHSLFPFVLFGVARCEFIFFVLMPRKFTKQKHFKF